MDDGTGNKSSARPERLAAALRANLKRRKAQARGRAESIDPAGTEAGERLQNHPDSGRDSD